MPSTKARPKFAIYGEHWGKGAARCFHIDSRALEEPRCEVRLVVNPEFFICPISKEAMRDPVAAVDGTVYDRGNIEKWFNDRSRRNKVVTSPLTGLQVASKVLMPVIALRRAVEAYLNSRTELREFIQQHASAKDQASRLKALIAEKDAAETERHAKSALVCELQEQVLQLNTMLAEKDTTANRAHDAALTCEEELLAKTALVSELQEQVLQLSAALLEKDAAAKARAHDAALKCETELLAKSALVGELQEQVLQLNAALLEKDVAAKARAHDAALKCETELLAKSALVGELQEQVLQLTALLEKDAAAKARAHDAALKCETELLAKSALVGELQERVLQQKATMAEKDAAASRAHDAALNREAELLAKSALLGDLQETAAKLRAEQEAAANCAREEVSRWKAEAQAFAAKARGLEELLSEYRRSADRTPVERREIRQHIRGDESRYSSSSPGGRTASSAYQLQQHMGQVYRRDSAKFVCHSRGRGVELRRPACFGRLREKEFEAMMLQMDDAVSAAFKLGKPGSQHGPQGRGSGDGVVGFKRRRRESPSRASAIASPGRKRRRDFAQANGFMIYVDGDA